MTKYQAVYNEYAVMLDGLKPTDEYLYPVQSSFEGAYELIRLDYNRDLYHSNAHGFMFPLAILGTFDDDTTLVASNCINVGYLVTYTIRTLKEGSDND